MKVKLQFDHGDAAQGFWKDPLLTYIAEHLKVITHKENRDIVKSMETMFTYINHLIDEFMTANVRYRKPSGFSICFCRPSCCDHKIKIEYQNQSITIKQIKDEKDHFNSDATSSTTVELVRK